MKESPNSRMTIAIYGGFSSIGYLIDGMHGAVVGFASACVLVFTCGYLAAWYDIL